MALCQLVVHAFALGRTPGLRRPTPRAPFRVHRLSLRSSAEEQTRLPARQVRRDSVEPLRCVARRPDFPPRKARVWEERVSTRFATRRFLQGVGEDRSRSWHPILSASPSDLLAVLEAALGYLRKRSMKGFCPWLRFGLNSVALALHLAMVPASNVACQAHRVDPQNPHQRHHRSQKRGAWPKAET